MTFNFESHGTNTYLVNKLADEDVIDTLSLGMITNNSIPGIARAIYTQMDNDRFIKYNIGSQTTLNKIIVGQMKRKWLLSIFNGIVDAMQSAEEYMILPQSLLFDPDYIFVDLAKDCVEMVCLPLIGAEENDVDASTFFKSIMVNARFDPSENSDYIPLIMNYLNGTPAFSAAEFKKLLVEEIKKKPFAVSGGVNGSVPSSDIKRETGSASNATGSAHRVQTASAGSNQGGSAARKEPDIPKPPVASDNKKPNVEKEPKPEKKGGLWGLFHKSDEEKSDSSIDRFDGMAIPGMEDGPLAGIEIPGNSKQPVVKSGTGSANSNSSDLPKQGFIKIQQKDAEVVSDDFGETVYKKADNADTAPAFDDDEMTRHVKDVFRPVGKFCVLSSRTDHIISKPKYQIGKDPKINDLVLSNNTVSRNKVVVYTRDGACFIRDLGATNHVLINDQMIDVNVDCRLNDSDIISLGTEKLKFEEL